MSQRAAPIPLDWTHQLEAVTALWRRERAGAIESAGRAHLRRLRARWRQDGTVPRSSAGRPLEHVPHRRGVAIWHANRARALRQRFDRLRYCGRLVKRVSECPSCGHRHEVPQGCGGRYVCQRCRIETASRFRVDFERKRRGLQWAIRSQGLNRRWRGRARWGERMATLTIPHKLADSVRGRIRIVQQAWPAFRRALLERWQAEARKLHRKRGEQFHNPIDGEGCEPESMLAYLRVLEWTPGADGIGHPHLHIWLCGPYVPREFLRSAWSAAVSDVAGVSVEVAAVHVERADDGASKELVKYLTKDICDDGRKVPPELYAQAWSALEGSRIRQTSAGLSAWSLPDAMIGPQRLPARVCPRCDAAFPAWRFWIEPLQPLLRHVPQRGTLPAIGPVAPADDSPYQRWMVERDRKWADDFAIELQILRGRLRKARPEREASHETEGKGQQSLAFGNRQ